MEKSSLGAHQYAYDAIFQHPAPHNLQWREVRSMLSVISDAVEERGDHLKFTRNGQTLIIHLPRTKDLSGLQEIMQIRHFLEQSESPAQPAIAQSEEVLLVIDHREARIFRVLGPGSIPVRITPFDPDGSHRQLRDVQNHSGHRKPELKAFYDAVARALEGSKRILIFGSAAGSSSSMDYLVSELKENHPATAARIVGTLIVDEKHTSDDQLLARARAFFKAHST